ncbi:protein kinase domain-containing protein [Umezawaea tangerina]|uniref:non-specific serine/threonine protein kinase n=1 Tax=Umezawaea tangerina TaxID=84725 RepID=A0A2T0TGD3_9PSEU|nr:protein kinase [Umezawaea tangerina]PRY44747.1 serine/threonine protein kinase [Umezawaea tangerina]
MTGEDFDLIGTGPVATVYGGLYLALKVFPSAAPPDALDAAERERAALDAIRDTAPILPVDDVLELPDGRTALQMELCSLSLAELVAGSGELLVADAVAVGLAVATAVAAAHRAGVVHGGLSPYNVLFHPSGAPVVADFGVALRRAFPVEQPTPYTAPETARDGTMDERSDLYGLGGVLHLALTGHPPSEGGEPPPELARLVTRLLAPDPADRPSTSDVVVRQLTALGEQDPPKPPRVEPPPVTSGPVARPRSRVGSGVVTGLLAGGAVLVALPFLLRATLATPSSAAPAPTPTVASSARSIPLTLDDPVDHGTYVDLSWQGEDGLAFAVVVAADDRKPEVRVAQRNRTMRVEVEEGREYCFQVQATDGTLVVESAPKAIRGAACKS